MPGSTTLTALEHLFFHANEESRFAQMTAKCCYMEANPHQFVDEINLRRNVS